MNLRTWPALDVGRLKPPPADGSDLLQAALVDYSIAAIDETIPDAWQVFFSSGAERDRAAEHLTREFPDLSIRPLDVPDEDWAAKSQADLRAVRIGHIIVAPPWDIPHLERPEQPIVIVIQPSMGFGTAHHATTRLCLAALQRVDVRGRSAIDVGTGSGVLAIAASRLGAAPVVGIDDDPDALHSAEENLSLNHVSGVTLCAADLRSGVPFDTAQGRSFDAAQGRPFGAARDGLKTFDLVMANLIGALLIQAAGQLRGLAAQRGRLILSGFMRHEETAVLTAYSDLTVNHRSEEEEWVCVDLERP